MTKKSNPWDPLGEQIDRIRSEYRDMPGLRLTFEQMLRLFMLDRRTGRVLLKRLLDARFLEATSDGQYVRCDVREPQSPIGMQPATSHGVRGLTGSNIQTS
jgi:hypothetical protein